MAVLGDLQLEVMEVVWRLGNATVAEVHEVLHRERGLAYTTVLSTMRALERRGYLEHTIEGKAHRFHACVSRADHTDQSVQHLVERLFAGQPEQLMSHLLGGEKLGARERTRIRKLLESDGRRP